MLEFHAVYSYDRTQRIVKIEAETIRSAKNNATVARKDVREDINLYFNGQLISQTKKINYKHTWFDQFKEPEPIVIGEEYKLCIGYGHGVREEIITAANLHGAKIKAFNSAADERAKIEIYWKGALVSKTKYTRREGRYWIDV